MAPREPATAGEAQIGSFSRVRPLMLRQRLVPREGRPAFVANIFLGLNMNILLVFFHVSQLREAFATHGAKMRFLSRVGQAVNIQILTGIKSFAADDAYVRSFPRVAPHVSFKSFGAGKAALAQGASERFLSRVGAEVAAEL